MPFYSEKLLDKTWKQACNKATEDSMFAHPYDIMCHVCWDLKTQVKQHTRSPEGTLMT